MTPRKTLKLALAAVVLAAPALAQQFTTAGEVKPILTATKSNWIAVREYDGRDLLYFTHLLAWRCGLTEIHYAVNDGPEERYDGEPCYEGEAQPNAIKATDIMPFLSFDLKSIDSVSVRVVYDDTSEDSARFERAAVMTQ
ncbi:hypothetical protein [Aliiroseovarius subalbicans]|uniref:hypothetical protein n=1 Tax=Aliiroseovarius subalbicans TaxID=2925840 RepID=UPI001F56042A|nr:hypothetical protein [Aliiroseovarius subalbicans]MCI2398104.1 hypothetical protein [Aliiroseovarius subalbicans]